MGNQLKVGNDGAGPFPNPPPPGPAESAANLLTVHSWQRNTLPAFFFFLRRQFLEAMAGVPPYSLPLSLTAAAGAAPTFGQVNSTVLNSQSGDSSSSSSNNGNGGWLLDPVRHGALTLYVDRTTSLAYVPAQASASSIAKQGQGAMGEPILYGR